MIGRVVSNKMQKSAVVLLEFSIKHPLYKKAVKKSKKYLVGDPIGVKIGDVVEFVKVKPISKNKHWQITKVLGQDFAEIVQVQLKKQAEKQIEEVMPEEKEVASAEGDPSTALGTRVQSQETEKSIKEFKTGKEEDERQAQTGQSVRSTSRTSRAKSGSSK